MLGGVSASGTGVLPLVGRVVHTAQEAKTAAAEGADLLVLSSGPRQKQEAQDAARAEVGVPLIALSGGKSSRGVVTAGADGVVLRLSELQGGRQAVVAQLDAIRAAVRRRSEGGASTTAAGGGNGSAKAKPKGPALGPELQLLDERGKELIEEERGLLTRLRDLLGEATPEVRQRGQGSEELLHSIRKEVLLCNFVLSPPAVCFTNDPKKQRMVAGR